jgi:hypothetical protein
MQVLGFFSVMEFIETLSVILAIVIGCAGILWYWMAHR